MPAVQIFTAAHADYHRPTDTADKIDVAGLVKVAAFVKEGIAYLGERPEPLTNTIKPRRAHAAPPAQRAGGCPAAGAPPRAARQLGTVPDFAFPGPASRSRARCPARPPRRPASRKATSSHRLDGKAVANLQGFSNILRGLTPGQTVKVVITPRDRDAHAGGGAGGAVSERR